MSGSGVVVCNPPYLLGRQLRAVLPGLVRSLGRSPEASFTLHEGGGSRSGVRDAPRSARASS
jgi:23S rRNA A2030 N6-methylase RlmJ